MKAGWKNDPVMRAYFEIKKAVWRHNCAVMRHQNEQFEALDEVAAELVRVAAAQAAQYKGTRH